MKKLLTLFTLALLGMGSAWAETAIVGYTEAISESTLAARSLTSGDSNVSIGDPIFGSAITDQGSKTVYIDGTSYTNTKSWRKSVNGVYDNQFVGYELTVASGYKMNVKNVNARIAVADDTYTWYVEILNNGGESVWKSSERTTKKSSSAKIENVDVSDKDAIQGLTGTVTVKLWVKQGGSTKYFSINYLQLTVETEVDDRTTYAMSVSSNDDTMGSVIPADGTEITEGENVNFTATPNTGYKFVKWTIDGTDTTENPYTIENVTSTHTAVATFAALYKVTYDLGEYAGTVKKVLNNANFKEVYADEDGKYTIPSYAHRYLYNEGYVLTGWSDGTNTYATGDVLTLTEDITLTPVWAATTQTLAASTSEVTITWNLAYSQILFNAWQGTNAVGYYTKPQTVNGELIAVPMIVDATGGKVDNSGRAAQDNAQVNSGTKFTIPAVSGMTITIANANTAFSSTTIAGSTEYELTNSNKTLTYTYTGTDETIDIVINEGNQYLKTIAVTYPAAPATTVDMTITAAGWATFSSTNEVAIPTGVTAYIAKAKDASTVTLSPISDYVPANTGVVIAGAEGTYAADITSTSAAAPADNLLKAWTAAGTPGDAEYYTLAVDGSNPVFKKSSGGELAAGKAYLVLSGAGARLSVVLEGSETTGISAMEAVKANSGETYNLQGQRVAAPQKGLYIVNGKKVILK